MRARSAALLCLVLAASDGALAQTCPCAAPPAPAACAAPATSRSFDDVFRHARTLDGQRVTVRGTLHLFFGCADRITAEGCIPMCGGEVTLVASATDLGRVIYVEARCSGESSACPCCPIDARDQSVEVTGVLRNGTTISIEGASICAR